MLLHWFFYLAILRMRFHAGEFHVQEREKKKNQRTTNKSHCILTVYFPKKPPASSGFQKSLSYNKKQEIEFSGRHTRSANEKIFAVT